MPLQYWVADGIFWGVTFLTGFSYWYSRENGPACMLSVKKCERGGDFLSFNFCTSTTIWTEKKSECLQWRDLQRSRLAETLAKLQALVETLNAERESLNAEREELERTIDSFTYPVFTVPVEILSHIFLDCLPAHGRVQPSPRAVPLVLAQTCPRWRDIAHSLPKLWSSVDLTFARANSPYAGTSALLGTWLRRTKGHPLSITLSSGGVSEAENVMLFKHFPHLLHLSASFVNVLSPSTPVLENIPPLESLIVWFGDPLPALTLPRLRRLQCQPESSSILLSFLLRSCCDLQHLALDARFVDGIGLMECLRAVPSLVRLDLFRRIDTRSFYQDLHSPLLPPQLRELSVFFLDRTYYLLDEVIKLLRARRDPHPTRVQLRSFDLGLDADDLVDDLSKPSNTAALQCLVADGLQFRVYREAENWLSGPARVSLQMEGQHRGIRTSPQSRGSREKWWRNGDGK
ncbi:hypothetical protein DFH09DRAFT_1497708 [Mycena vulgaris]|nr:hypothetical protein DFH09DRAFT_1497708 [Mycena vulgaris]